MTLSRAVACLSAVLLLPSCIATAESEADAEDEDEVAVAQQAIEPTCPTAPSVPATPNSDQGVLTDTEIDAYTITETVGYQDACDYAGNSGDFWTVEWDNLGLLVLSQAGSDIEYTTEEDCTNATIRATVYAWAPLYPSWVKVFDGEDNGDWNGTTCTKPLVYYNPDGAKYRVRVRAHAAVKDGQDWETAPLTFTGFGPNASFP